MHANSALLLLVYNAACCAALGTPPEHTCYINKWLKEDRHVLSLWGVLLRCAGKEACMQPCVVLD